MKHIFDKILYGGDYNPNQWGKEIWKEDMEYFRRAHINSATINVFSWAKLQPSEETYDFSELDEIVETLSRREKLHLQGFPLIIADLCQTACFPILRQKKKRYAGMTGIPR